MAEELAVKCARPTGGPVGENIDDNVQQEKKVKEEKTAMIKIGKKAPDFSAPGFHKDKFISVKLSDYLGKWVLLCFYPGDFTFV